MKGEDSSQGVDARILYEDNHLIAVNKLCGEISQGDRSGDETLGDLIAAHIRQRDNKPGNVYITPVHRLDRPVSGIIVFAKTSKAAARMSRLFRESGVTKRYWAIVTAPPPLESDTLIHYLARNRKLNKSFAVVENTKRAKRAELEYRHLVRSDRYDLLEIDMASGRHHQIRVQLSTIGCPIKGDLKYGASRSNPDGGISLHARSVRFEHPVGRGMIEIVAPLPDERLWQVFRDMIESGDT